MAGLALRFDLMISCGGIVLVGERACSRGLRLLGFCVEVENCSG